MNDYKEKVRKCKKCSEEKPLELFRKNKSCAEGRTYECLVCTREYKRNLEASNKEHFKKYKKKYRTQGSRRAECIKKDYGISYDEYVDIYNRDLGKCRICSKTLAIEKTENLETASIDHCHKSGRIRGILCGKCNIGIGMFDENLDLLLKARDYLIETSN